MVINRRRTTTGGIVVRLVTLMEEPETHTLHITSFNYQYEQTSSEQSILFFNQNLYGLIDW